MYTYLNHEGRYCLDIYYSDSNYENKSFELASQFQSFTTDTIFKIKTVGLHRIEWYQNDTIIGYRNTRTSVPLRLRVDDFGDMDLEYIKIQKL